MISDLLYEHSEEAKSKSLLLGHDDGSYSALRKPSWKVFYSATAMSPTRP